LLLTLNLDTIALMPCNPSIGGQGKGQLVREIDALGGEMALAADDTSIQARLLNTSKGLAVQSIRVQSDKVRYGRRMLAALLACPNLSLVQGLVTEIVCEAGVLTGVRTAAGDTLRAPVVVLTAGTFLRGVIHIGDTRFAAGRAGEPPADDLGQWLETEGFPVIRFKTGTPPRVETRSIDFSGLDVQADEPGTPRFSLRSGALPALPRERCYLTHTNEQTHDIIRRNMERSALVAGRIQGMGPRYCPSIEDKIRKFPEKTAHKVFLEPEGVATAEIYLQGLSTSLPEEVQIDYVRSLPGLGAARITRPGYAIEYDIVDPTDLFPTLMSRRRPNLFFAGQVNGTSGYEEAAGQGLLAGLNAAATALGRPAVILAPEQSYIGLMIEEITTQGLIEPYRIFTSRSPHRLHLRMSNAEERLTGIGHAGGLLGPAALATHQERLAAIDGIVHELGQRTLTEAELRENGFAVSSTSAVTGTSAASGTSPVTGARNLNVGEDTSTGGCGSTACSGGASDTAGASCATIAGSDTSPSIASVATDAGCSAGATSGTGVESGESGTSAGRATLRRILHRPGVSFAQIAPLLAPITAPDAMAEIEIEARVKYAGYLAQQHREIAMMQEFQNEPIPVDFFDEPPAALSTEARQRLIAVRPGTLGAFARVPGIRATDVTLLLMHLRKRGRAKGLDARHRAQPQKEP
jgi:tRNA uridine 5-carboxymethylaminomethyl modification enzyme